MTVLPELPSLTPGSATGAVVNVLMTGCQSGVSSSTTATAAGPSWLSET
ncbi:hypothetical protein DSM112329_05083 [Paraconexibacter sp. AEG42_29]|uniref:Uncharacterized protein n=1 Tax=Paraconexibacter sp. AEG42_29 TaxID=2997339 RepID=A0AAU7B2G2_9ACTN